MGLLSGINTSWQSYLYMKLNMNSLYKEPVIIETCSLHRLDINGIITTEMHTESYCHVQ